MWGKVWGSVEERCGKVCWSVGKIRGDEKSVGVWRSVG